MLLRVEGLDIGRRDWGGTRPLVRDVTFAIDRGEALGIVGESGSGKSLTALSVMGMLPAGLTRTAGSIVFDGRELSGLPEADIHKLRGRRIGLVFQDPLSALNPTLTVGTQLGDVLRRHQGMNRADAFRAGLKGMGAVGIDRPEARMAAYPHQLSGGMRQRVLIAMVLAGRPDLLIADEPTTALDVTVQAKIIELLRQIRQSGVSILFISHNLDLVAEFCDRVLVMYGGAVMETGPTAAIMRRPRHPYTKALLECVPRFEPSGRTLRVIPGQPRSDLAQAPGCPFVERCDRAQDRCRDVRPVFNGSDGGNVWACWNPNPAAVEEI